MFAQPCVFAKQLPGPILCASPGGEDPFSRSYGVSLPNSLTMNLSTPQYILPDYLCRSAVRVPDGLSLAGFLGSMITCTVARPRRGGHTFCRLLRPRTSLRPSAHRTFNGEFRIPAAVPLLRRRIAPKGSHGMLTVSSIALAARLKLRARLNPG